MKLHSLKWTKLVLLAACVSLGLAGLGFSALDISPGHLRLIGVLQDDARTSRDNLQPVIMPAGFTTVEPTAVSADGGKAVSGNGIKNYRQPDGAERELLLAGLADRIRAMQAGDFVRDQAALAGYFELREKSGATMLAGVDSLAGLLPVPRDAVEELEPNGDWELAQQLVLGDTLSGAGVPFEDVDVFKFEAEAGQYVRIEALPLETDVYGMGYVIVRLFAPDSTQVQGGFYTLYEDVAVRSEDVSGRLVWPGGNLVGASLEEAGTYYVVVETYPGDIRWLDSETQVQGEGVNNDEIAYRLTVNTLATGRIDGLVLDDRGGPVEGAVVQFWSYDGVGGARAVTGSDGGFVQNLPAGKWGVNIEGPEGGPYPSGQPQQEFSFKGGDIAVTFELARGVVFSGRVETSRGELAPHVGFSLIDTGKGQYRWGQSDENGTFSVAVFPGTFSIHLHTGNIYPKQPVTDSVAITSDTSYVITLETGYRVSGRLHDAANRTLDGTRITFYGELDLRTVYTSEDGSYGLNLLEGTYRAEVWPRAELLVPQQATGPYEITSDTELDIQLARGGVIGGTVYDDRGNPVEDAQVNLWSVENWEDPGAPSDSIRYAADGVIYFEEQGQDNYPDLVDPMQRYSDGSDGSMSRYYNLRTDSSGQWRTALLAGDYAVDVAAPHPYPSQRVKVGTFTLADGSIADAGRVEVAFGVLFSGTVMLDASTPLAWSGFKLVPESDGKNYIPEGGEDYGNMVQSGRIHWVSTGETGEFSVQIVPGTYDLVFDSRGSQQMFPPQRFAGLVLEADTRKDITLEAGHVVSGRVVSETGEALASSRLDFYESTGAWRAAVFSGSDGEFAARLVAGDYNMLISPAKGYFPDSSSYALSIESDIQIEVVLRPGVRVHGRVTASDGHPLGGIMVQLVPHFSWPSGSESDHISFASFASFSASDSSAGSDAIINPIYPIGPPIPVQRSQFVGYSDSDGYWEVIVRPGAYDIFASPSFGGFANAFLPNIFCSGETEVNLVLEQAEIVFEGMVTDKGGQPAPGSLVSLFDPKNGDHVSAFTDDAGRFQIDLPMGDYEIFIEGPSGSGELPTSEHLKLDSDTQVNIQLGRGLLENGPSGPQLPRAFALSQNSPNPFNPSTTISYALEQQAQVTLAVYDLRGRTVAVLVDRVQDEGDYDVQWNGKDRSGRQLSSGVYMYRLSAGQFRMTRKMVLLK